jgi:UDPglucose 6-dehydrogenase
MKVTVIGSGVVGQATGKGLAQKGHEVVFCDINPLILDKLKEEKYEVCLPEELNKDSSVYMFCVSTPTVDGEIELNFLKSAVASFAREVLEKSRDGNYPLAIIRSTIPPGTTRGVLLPIMERYSRRRAGKDFGVCMNPEFLREKSSLEDSLRPWVIIAGSLTGRCRKIIEELYRSYECSFFHTTLEEAEMQKYTHNLLNANKISFFNEMRAVCLSLGIDAEKVFRLVAKSAEASWNPEYGIRNFGAFGGSCLPKDTQAFLSWSRKEIGVKLNLLDAVIKVNEKVKEQPRLERKRKNNNR